MKKEVVEINFDSSLVQADRDPNSYRSAVVKAVKSIQKQFPKIGSAYGKVVFKSFNNPFPGDTVLQVSFTPTIKGLLFKRFDNVLPKPGNILMRKFR